MPNLTTEEILLNNIKKLGEMNEGHPSSVTLTTVDAIFRILIKLERKIAEKECKCPT